MTNAVFQDKLLQLLNQKPFQPFLIEFDDGGQWIVAQREAIMYQDGATAIYFRLDGSFEFVDSHNVKRFLKLVPVETP